MATKTKDELQRDLDSAKAQLATAVKQLDDFKSLVSETVLEMKPEYDLCEDGVNEFFDRVGLERPLNSYVFNISGRLNITGGDDSAEVVFIDIEKEIQRIIKDYDEGDLKVKNYYGGTSTRVTEVNLDEWYQD